MTFIPSPFMFVCMFRMIWRSIISRSIILGCNFAQQEPDPTQPDNVILLTDGLPTMGKTAGRGTVTPRQRLKLFDQAYKEVPKGTPFNVLLYPMEGDPKAASSFWQLAMATRGSFMSLSEDWP